jgi:hypothetical protein
MVAAGSVSGSSDSLSFLSQEMTKKQSPAIIGIAIMRLICKNLILTKYEKLLRKVVSFVSIGKVGRSWNQHNRSDGNF